MLLTLVTPLLFLSLSRTLYKIFFSKNCGSSFKIERLPERCKNTYIKKIERNTGKNLVTHRESAERDTYHLRISIRREMRGSGACVRTIARINGELVRVTRNIA